MDTSGVIHHDEQSSISLFLGNVCPKPSTHVVRFGLL